MSANDCSLVPSEARILGGGAISVNKEFALAELRREDCGHPEVEFPLYSRSILVFPQGRHVQCMKVAGVVCLPGAATTVVQVE